MNNKIQKRKNENYVQLMSLLNCKDFVKNSLSSESSEALQSKSLNELKKIHKELIYVKIFCFFR